MIRFLLGMACDIVFEVAEASLQILGVAITAISYATLFCLVGCAFFMVSLIIAILLGSPA